MNAMRTALWLTIAPAIACGSATASGSADGGSPKDNDDAALDAAGADNSSNEISASANPDASDANVGTACVGSSTDGAPLSCAATTAVAPAVNSSCTDVLPPMVGGAISDGRYALTSEAFYGCQDGGVLASGFPPTRRTPRRRATSAKLRRSARALATSSPRSTCSPRTLNAPLDPTLPLDLASPGNSLEKLKGDRAGSYSIRINDQWRIIFAFEKGQASAVRIADYH